MFEQTLLDLVLTIDVDAFESLIDGVEQDADEIRYKMATFLIDESPELARIRNEDDELPIHVVLKNVRDIRTDGLLTLLYKAAPRSAEMRGLCYSCSRSFHKARGITVGSVYTLLRECPHLIAGAISARQEGSPEGKETNKVSDKLSDESSISLVKEELNLSRRRLEFERLSIELGVEENEVKRKKRMRMQDSSFEEISEIGQVAIGAD